MQPAPSEVHVQTLFDKAVAAGLTKVTVTHSSDSLVNYQGSGRRNRAYTSLSAKGTAEQETAFKGSLEGAESEDLEVELMGPSAGDDCPQVKVFATATGEEKTFAWAADDPKVYLIDFWATWCGPCQHPMAHNQEMLAKNPEWEGRAEIVAISLDDDKEAAEKRIQEKGWTKVSSYWGGEGGFQAPVPGEFKIDGIPTCLLVKKGKILWRGHPSERELEADINHLLTNDDLPQKAASNDNAAGHVLMGEELEQKMVEVEKLLNDFVAANPATSSPFFVYIVKTEKTAQGIARSSRIITGGSYIHKFKAVVEPLGERLKEMFSGIESRFNFSEPIPEISRGDKCVLCNKVLTEADVQYLCPYCEPKHYHCQACEDAPREGAGSAKLAHPHKLYKITPLSGHFDELRFGPNYPQDEILTEDPAERRHRCGCDNRNSPGGCDGSVVGVRYKCAHCRDFDFCEACEKLFWDTAPEEMKSTMKGMGHMEYHVLLKIHFP